MFLILLHSRLYELILSVLFPFHNADSPPPWAILNKFLFNMQNTVLENLLITGCTGSFGKAFLRKLVSNHPELRVVIYGRDGRAWELQRFIPLINFHNSDFS